MKSSKGRLCLLWAPTSWSSLLLAMHGRLHLQYFSIICAFFFFLSFLCFYFWYGVLWSHKHCIDAYLCMVSIFWFWLVLTPLSGTYLGKNSDATPRKSHIQEEELDLEGHLYWINVPGHSQHFNMNGVHLGPFTLETYEMFKGLIIASSSEVVFGYKS